MTMLEDLVNRAADELRLREKAVDEVLARARRVRILSKQAILHVHNDDVKDAVSKLMEADRLLREMSEVICKHTNLECFDQVSAAREEYVEASIIRGLKTSGEFPAPEDLGVPINTYVMGLGDVPGELRRQALDALRVGDVDLAESRLVLMERIYLSLVSMEEAPFLRGLRRKLDVARGVIERTRSELTAEIGRRTPDAGAGRSTLALSVSRTQIGSSFST